MNEPLGPLISGGRAADVFAVGNATVIKRYRDVRQLPRREEQVMRFAAEQGIGVPRVIELGDVDVVGLDPDRDIAMEMVEGPTMFDLLRRRPWMALSYGRLLAQLHRQIGAVVAPSWLVAPETTAPNQTPSTGSRSTGSRSDGVLHLGLHPSNVIIAPTGPVVTGWSNAGGGPASFDAALTYVLLATTELRREVSGAGLSGSDLSGSGQPSAADVISGRVMSAAFRRASGPRRIDAYITAACDHRLLDTHITPGERADVAALRTKAKARAARTTSR